MKWLIPLILKDLSKKQLGLLARNTLELTRQAYRTSGVTNTAGRVKKLQSQGVTRSRYRFLAFDRERASCYHCGDIILAAAGQRSPYLSLCYLSAELPT